jgi:ubiquinone/menaquinone biosynthesis C-methylase UbiE
MSISPKLEDRVLREQEAHEINDVLARSHDLKRRFSHIQQTPGWLEMEARQAALIHSMAGADVLDYGCGRGEMALKYLDAGARYVHGIDISQKYVKDASDRCIIAGKPKEKFTFHVMDAHALMFPNASFDWVIGRGILHHLDLPVAMAEIKRVLRPEGHAVFLEPLADNPLLRFFRFLTPQARTPDERPLTQNDLDLIAKDTESKTYYFGLLSSPVAMLTSVLIRHRPNNIAVRSAHQIESVLRRRNWLNSYHQYAFLVIRYPDS